MESKSSDCTSNSSVKIEDAFQCPSCNSRISISEVASHCEMEMERLRQMRTEASTKIAENIVNNAAQEQQRGKPYSVFQRVQRNRQTRLKRSRKRATPPVPTEHVCPICQHSFPANEIHSHTERCLRKNNNGHSNGGGGGGGDGNSSNDDDDGEDGYAEEYEEYEWAGQKRIRASSLLEGGYSSLGIGQSTVCRNGGNGSNDTDDDEDLNVDEDDTQIYGPTQYNEADIIPTEDDASSYMRSLITGNVQTSIKATTTTMADDMLIKEGTESNLITATNNSGLSYQPSSSSSRTTMTAGTVGSLSKNLNSSNSSHFQQIIDSLKSKLRYYENHIPSKYKCLICLDDYKKPAISVSCWHVHCEDCWLRSLGARKLCPQCNLITTPKDLRRIYM